MTFDLSISRNNRQEGESVEFFNFFFFIEDFVRLLAILFSVFRSIIYQLLLWCFLFLLLTRAQGSAIKIEPQNEPLRMNNQRRSVYQDVLNDFVHQYALLRWVSLSTYSYWFYSMLIIFLELQIVHFKKNIAISCNSMLEIRSAIYFQFCG